MSFIRYRDPKTGRFTKPGRKKLVRVDIVIRSERFFIQGNFLKKDIEKIKQNKDKIIKRKVRKIANKIFEKERRFKKFEKVTFKISDLSEKFRAKTDKKNHFRQSLTEVLEDLDLDDVRSIILSSWSKFKKLFFKFRFEFRVTGTIKKPKIVKRVEKFDFTLSSTFITTKSKLNTIEDKVIELFDRLLSKLNQLMGNYNDKMNVNRIIINVVFVGKE